MYKRVKKKKGKKLEKNMKDRIFSKSGLPFIGTPDAIIGSRSLVVG